MAGPDDGWETITDPGDVPADIRKSLGVAGVRSALGLSSGTGASGKAIPEWADKKYSPQIETYAGLSSALSSFKDDFGGNTVTGGIENKLQGLYSGFGTEGQRDWWATFKSNDNQIRNKLFGSALTDSEKAAYEATTIDPSMDPKEIRRNLTTRRGIVQKALQRTTKFLTAQGYNPESIAALAGEYAPELGAAPVEQAKGGDQTSGAVGVATDGSGAPPTGPVGGGLGGGIVAFNDELPAQQAAPLNLSSEQTNAMQALVQSGAPADAIIALGKSFGANITPENAAALEKFYADPTNRSVAPTVNVDNTVKPVDAGDGMAGAAARGAGNALTLGFLDEAGALADTVSQGGTYSDNLDKRRGQELFDEQQHGTSRFIGQLVGGLPLGGVEFMGAREAAAATARAAVRNGMAPAEARALATRVFSARTAAEAAGIGGVYGAGDAEGGLADRAAGAGIGAATSAALGGIAAYGGSRFARAMAARQKGVAAVAPSEASQIADLADEQGIKLLPQDIASGPGIGRATAGAAQTPFGANTVRQRASETYDSFRDRVTALAGGTARSLNDAGAPIKEASARLAAREGQRAEQTSGAVADQLGQAPDLTGAGQLIQRGASKWLRDTSERASKLYDRISVPDSFDATLDATRGALKDLTEGFKSNKALSVLWAENPRLKATLAALTPDEEGEGGKVAWSDLKRFRSILGEIVGQPGLEADGNQIAALRKLYGAVSSDMRSTAAEAGPDALNEFNRANSYFGARSNRVRNTVAKVLGDDNNATAGEAFGAVESALKDSASGDAGFARRVLASLPDQDANAVRATIVSRARGGSAFDPKQLAKVWGGISERGKSVLLPQAGLRDIMDDAAARAAAAAHDPLEGKSAEQVYLAVEKAAEDRGNSAGLARRMASLPPEEAQAVRTLFVNRMGMASAGQQDAAGEAFSVAKFLTRWNTMSEEARTVLFGNGELRDNMTAVAKLAERVKATEKLAGHSNTGAVNSFNATTGGLGGAALAFITGHPIVGFGLAAPAAYQRLSAEALTSPQLLKWLARAPKKPNIQAQRAHIRSLSSVARSEPAIATDVLALQQRLADAFGTAPARLAAQERDGGSASIQGQQSQPAGPQQGLQP